MLDITVLVFSSLVSLVGVLILTQTHFLFMVVEADATMRYLHLRTIVHSLNLLVSVLDLFFIDRWLLQLLLPLSNFKMLTFLDQYRQVSEPY